MHVILFPDTLQSKEKIFATIFHYFLWTHLWSEYKQNCTHWNYKIIMHLGLEHRSICILYMRFIAPFLVHSKMQIGKSRPLRTKTVLKTRKCQTQKARAWARFSINMNKYIYLCWHWNSHTYCNFGKSKSPIFVLNKLHLYRLQVRGKT